MKIHNNEVSLFNLLLTKFQVINRLSKLVFKFIENLMNGLPIDSFKAIFINLKKEQVSECPAEENSDFKDI